MSDAEPKKPVRPILPEPWSPAEATDRLRQMASDPDSFDISLKLHAAEQMELRDITMPDVIYAMRIGFVLDPPEEAKQPGLYKYTMKGPTPSSNTRDICIVVLPSMHKAHAKIITVMWADEPRIKG